MTEATSEWRRDDAVEPIDIPRVPAPRDLVFVAHTRREDAAHTPEPRFGNDRWPLGQIDHSSTQNSLTIDFTTFPEWSRSAVKTYIWNLLNTHPVHASAKSRRSHLSPASVHGAARHLRYFASWLDAEGARRMSEVTDETFEAYASDVAGQKGAWSTKSLCLLYLSRVYMHNDGLPGGLSFSRPPWFDQDFKHWLGQPNVGYENRTSPIAPEVMGPLLNAALWVIDRYLEGNLVIGNLRNIADARTWARANGVAVSAKGNVSADVMAAYKEATNWTPNFDPADVRAACIIVVAYLTGMRSKEVLHLLRDCLRVEDEDGRDGAAGVKRYRILGHVFKNVTDAEGRALTSGTHRRQPWVTIEPAARAVMAARRLAGKHPSGLLFAPFRTPDGPRERHGDGLTTHTANKDIRDFAARWNLLAANDPTMQPIPMTEVVTTEVLDQGLVVAEQEEREGLSLGRLRRTLAWHIARQPGGEIALGVQYGHMRIVTSLGYAGRAESGFPDDIEFDELLAAWDGLDLLTRELQSGTIVSGPAAARLQEGVDRYGSDFAGQVKTEAQLKRLRETGLHVIHDNPLANNVCVFRRATAACLTETSDRSDRQTPDLTNCQKNCPNIAMLDSHIESKRQERQDLAAEIPYLPKPLADRNQQQVERLDATIARHEDAGTRGGSR